MRANRVGVVPYAVKTAAALLLLKMVEVPAAPGDRKLLRCTAIPSA